MRSDEPLAKAPGFSPPSFGPNSIVTVPSSGPDLRRSVAGSDPWGISAVDVAISTPLSMTWKKRDRCSYVTGNKDRMCYLTKFFFQSFVTINTLTEDITNNRIKNSSASVRIRICSRAFRLAKARRFASCWRCSSIGSGWTCYQTKEDQFTLKWSFSNLQTVIYDEHRYYHEWHDDHTWCFHKSVHHLFNRNRWNKEHFN